jgi:hypothetical protein
MRFDYRRTKHCSGRGTAARCSLAAQSEVGGGSAPAAEAWVARRIVTGAAEKEDHMSLAMTRQEREAFLADVHVGIITDRNIEN